MKTAAIIVLMLISTSIFAQDREVTKVYLIRHAEISNDGSKDPKLSEEGLERAKKWAKLFSPEKIDVIYSTDLSRTQTTAKIIADGNNISSVTSYTPNRLFDFENFLTQIKGKTIIIVGHSNTTPFFANAFLGEQKFGEMSEADFGSLYVVAYFSEDEASASLFSVQ